MGNSDLPILTPPYSAPILGGQTPPIQGREPSIPRPLIWKPHNATSLQSRLD
jgi:hypothetical protein